MIKVVPTIVYPWCTIAQLAVPTLKLELLKISVVVVEKCCEKSKIILRSLYFTSNMYDKGEIVNLHESK